VFPQFKPTPPMMPATGNAMDVASKLRFMKSSASFAFLVALGLPVNRDSSHHACQTMPLLHRATATTAQRESPFRHAAQKRHLGFRGGMVHERS
jgi:hypothetical protein